MTFSVIKHYTMYIHDLFASYTKKIQIFISISKFNKTFFHYHIVLANIV